MRIVRVMLCAVGATLTLAALTAAAAARNLSVSETRATATVRELRFTGGFGTTTCNVTLTGVMHARTMPKVLESLVGLVTEASVGGCSIGSATILRETLPWHTRYNGFSGTLPNITGILIKVIGDQFRIQEPVFGIACLATSTASSPSTATWTREAGGRLTSVAIGGTVPTSCGLNGTLSGTSNSLTPAVTVTLI